jgi:hypothetical protein
MTHQLFKLDPSTPGYLCSSGGGAVTDPAVVIAGPRISYKINIKLIHK